MNKHSVKEKMMFLPQKLSKITLAIAISTTMVGCANLSDSYEQSKQQYTEFQQITDQYNLYPYWWKLYKDPELDKLVDLALANNKDLAKAALNVNIALYQANLVGANLVPSFSAKATASISKNITTGTAPTNSTLDSARTMGGSLNVGYTLDLWRRMANLANAAEWQHKATVEDLESAKLSLINAVVTTYYNLAYLKEAVDVTKQSVDDYARINTIMENKQSVGVVDGASTNQTAQALYTAQNSLTQLLNQQKTAEVMMRNLLNLKPNEPLNITYPNLLNAKVAPVNLDVPTSVIANRPDVKGALFKLYSAFDNATATQKSWFPTITLGASLASQGVANNYSTTFRNPIASGLVSVDLPFLAWNTVRWNVNISEAQYNIAKLNFEQSITSALNDIDKNYFVYKNSQSLFTTQEKIYKTSVYMENYYRNRYEVGVTELRDWLTAKNQANAARLNLLNTKNSLIQSEIAIYSAMGGYYFPKQNSKTKPATTQDSSKPQTKATTQPPKK